MIMGGRNARKAVAGAGAQKLSDIIELRDVEWRTLGADLLLTALVG
jgi:riboflavin biosynthesis pyrimidine reductase